LLVSDPNRPSNSEEDLQRFACPCCGFITLLEEPPGTYEICGICGWEDDYVQFRDPDFRGGANHESLREARSAFADRLATHPEIAGRARRAE
jgi:hypothetical protein